ncbi:MAG: hypothetical protein ACR2NB_02575 [Solirubrobacteraceae bacterium]
MPCTASEYSKFAYFFNHVPLRSILSDTERYPSFAQLGAAATVDDGDEGPRTPSNLAALLTARAGDAGAFWSIDDAHLDYLSRGSA